MNRGLLILGLASVAGAANAQILFNGTHFENFDGIVAGTGTFSATIGAQSAIPGEGEWQGTKNAGTGTTATNMTLDTGAGNSGGIYGYRNAGSAEFALGELASGSNSMTFGVQIVNVGANALSSITVFLTQENWRTSTSATGAPNTLTFEWARSSGSAATAADFLTSTSGFVGATALNLVGPAPVTTNGAIDGNNPVNQVIKNHVFNFSTPLGVGESLFIRWADFNDQGNDAGIGIDNFELTSTAVPEPATMAVLGLGAAALLRRRKK